MKIRKSIDIAFSHEDVKEALILLLDCELNDTVCNTTEYHKRKGIIDRLKKESTTIDCCEDNLYLLCDGVEIEDF